MTTDISEKGLEALIVAHMIGQPAGPGFEDQPEPFVGLHNWLLGNPQDYDRAWTVDLAQLTGFFQATQPKLAEQLDLGADGPTRQKFLARLQGV